MSISFESCVRYRARLKDLTRRFFNGRNYLEIETPLLVVSPGTEVHLDYFSTEWVDHYQKSHPLFLRSSPEIHMKRALSCGVDRVFQVGPCFRNNGEMSPLHEPEFSMLEWYQVGMNMDALIAETESYLRFTADEMSALTGISAGKILPNKIERLTVYEAFKDFAKIDLIDGDPELAPKAVKNGSLSVQLTDDFETAYFKILMESVEPEIAKVGAVVLYNYPPSQAALARVESGRAKRFEFYLGRVELCNGFFELLGRQENKRRIDEANELRLSLGKSAVPEDKDFLNAVEKLEGDVSGNALGFDRWLMLLLQAGKLQDVIPFTIG